MVSLTRSNVKKTPYQLLRCRVLIKRSKGNVTGVVTKYDHWLQQWTVKLETGQIEEIDFQDENFEVIGIMVYVVLQKLTYIHSIGIG